MKIKMKYTKRSCCFFINKSMILFFLLLRFSALPKNGFLLLLLLLMISRIISFLCFVFRVVSSSHFFSLFSHLCVLQVRVVVNLPYLEKCCSSSIYILLIACFPPSVQLIVYFTIQHTPHFTSLSLSLSHLLF